MGSKGEVLTVWPLEPIPPGMFRAITVEINATESEARGTFTLKLWTGETGAGSVNLGGVMLRGYWDPRENSRASGI